MTDPAPSLLSTVLPPLIYITGPILVVLVVDWRANRKLNQIHVLTNSTLTAANRRIDVLEKLVRKLYRQRRKAPDARKKT